MVGLLHRPARVIRGRTVKGRYRIGPVTLCVSALTLALAACGGRAESDAPTPSVVTSVTTQTVTATPEDLPDGLGCHPPSVESFQVDWTREFGPGIPPPLGENDVRPFNYFSVYRAKRAEVRLLNLSPHRIYTRGVSFLVMWSTPDGTVKTNAYLYASPVDDLFGTVPEQKNTLTERRSRYVNGGDTISFSRDYSPKWTATVGGSEAPSTWIEPSGIDWWFADPAVRKQCGQPDPR